MLDALPPAFPETHGRLTGASTSVTYLLNLGFAAWAMWPNKELNSPKDEEDGDSTGSAEPKPWEMQNMRSPTGPSPFTPRTQAFHTLDRQLPLRQKGERFA